MNYRLTLMLGCLLSVSMAGSPALAESMAWTPWEDLGGTLTGDVSCTNWSLGGNLPTNFKYRIDCFARGEDVGVHQRTWTGNAWLDWQNLDVAVSGSPECVSRKANHIDCIVIGANKATLHRALPGYPTKGSWTKIANGEKLASAIDCVSNVDRIACFTRATDGTLHHMWLSPTQWVGWTSLGGQIASAPSCVGSRCFARGIDDAMVEAAVSGSEWVWRTHGGTIASEPDCLTVWWSSWTASSGQVYKPPSTSSKDSATYCFVPGADGTLYTYGLGQGGWRGLGRKSASPANCVRRSHHWRETQQYGGVQRTWLAGTAFIIDCFVRGPDNALHHYLFDFRDDTTKKSTERWESLGGDIKSTPECVTWPDRDRIDCFAIGADKALKHIAYDVVPDKGCTWIYVGGKPRCRKNT